MAAPPPDGFHARDLTPQTLPPWIAPFGWRAFTPALLIGLLVFNLGLVTLTWLHRPAAASRLMWLWIPGLTGAVLLCIAWRALLRQADARARARG
jgi:hypothetical protein